jgi:hypothetical protein
VYTLDDLRRTPVWRHVATDSLYHVLGVARCSTNGDRDGKEWSVVYFSLSYQSWRYREVGEFLDGRFVPEPPEKK